MSQENQLTPEEATEMQRYNDSTQKAHEGLTEDNNKRIRLVLTKRLFICAGKALMFASSPGQKAAFLPKALTLTSEANTAAHKTTAVRILVTFFMYVFLLCYSFFVFYTCGHL